MHTGAKLVVLNENLPSCAHEEDEVLEIKGRAQSVMQVISLQFLHLNYLL